MRIARARSLGLSEIMSAIWVLEYLLELFLIGCPCSCLRAIAHDLPWSAAACQVRWVIRTWILMAGSKDFSNMKNLRRKRGSVITKIWASVADQWRTSVLKCDALGDDGKGQVRPRRPLTARAREQEFRDV